MFYSNLFSLTFGLIATALVFIDLWFDKKQDFSKLFFEKVWIAISNNKLVDFPDIVVLWLLKKSDSIFIFWVSFLRQKNVIKIGVISVSLGGIIWLTSGGGGGGGAKHIGSWIVLLGLYAAVFLLRGPGERPTFSRRVNSIIYGWIVASYIIILWGSCTFILSFSIGIAVILVSLLLPYWYFLVYMIFTYIKIASPWCMTNKRSNESLIILSCGIAASFSVTMIALFTGHLYYPNEDIPSTTQMLAVNSICDGLTLLITFKLLGWAVKKESLFRIPVAIIIDVLLSAFLACMSLFLGLLARDSMTVSQTLWILFGYDISGSQYQFGPLFWVMHTTFIPTFVYLFFLFICWYGKVFLVIAEFFLGKAKVHSKPFSLTAGLLFLIIACLNLLLFIIKNTSE